MASDSYKYECSYCGFPSNDRPEMLDHLPECLISLFDNHSCAIGLCDCNAPDDCVVEIKMCIKRMVDPLYRAADAEASDDK